MRKVRIVQADTLKLLLDLANELGYADGVHLIGVALANREFLKIAYTLSADSQVGWSQDKTGGNDRMWNGFYASSSTDNRTWNGFYIRRQATEWGHPDLPGASVL